MLVADAQAHPYVDAHQGGRMTQKRNRAKQTTTLDARLARYTAELRQEAQTLPHNSDEELKLRKRIRQGEAALRLNASLTGGK
jgi:hypothetical protein